MILSIINTISNLIDKILPDKESRDAAKAELLKLQSSGELKVMLKQIELNMVEAKTGPKVSWRQATGYVCVAIFGYHYLLQPFLILILQLFGVTLDLPKLDTVTIMPIMLTLLGAYSVRGWEKKK